MEMAFISKIVRKLDRYYQQKIVKDQYPMLTSLSRNKLLREGVIGLIFMLHHVTEKDPSRIPTNEDLKVSPSFLEKVILRYKKEGFDFLSLDQLYDFVSKDKFPNRPFIVFTIDDGYLDNYTKALPVFDLYQVPFAIFVATDFIDKKAILWWDSLEELLLTHDEVTTCDGKSYPCQSFQQRWDTFRYLRERVLNLNQDKLVEELDRLFSEYHIDWYAPIEQKGLSWNYVRELSEHPLCTIGGHTVSHPALNQLLVENAKSEIVDGIRKIEAVTQQKVHYFAYPYGTPNEIGEREYQIVADLDIRFAFMAHQGCLTQENIRDVVHLPRFYLHETSHLYICN